MARDPITLVVKKLKKLKGALKIWNTHTFKDVHLSVSQAQAHIRNIQETKQLAHNDGDWFN